MFNKNKIFTALFIIVILYFSFFFLFGRYGFIKYSQLKREEELKSKELSIIKEENETVQNRINGLKSSSIDKDLLDEQVRKNLGYVEENEKVIYYKD